MDKDEIKVQIQRYIEEGMLEEAGQAIEQYKKIIGYDDEIASMEAVISIYAGNYRQALSCIKAGLEVNIFNGDLYFTMGNVYEMMREYNRAYLCYNHALAYTSKEENSNVILNAINNLKYNYDIDVKNYSIVILTYNNLDYTKVCIDSIRKYNGYDNCEIIIIDNNSTDGTVEWIKEQKEIKYILNDENKGFPAGCNQGIEISDKNNDIFLLNNDTVIMPNSIFNLRMGLYSNENIGATGSVSNSISYYQQVNVNYDNFDGYIKFASKNNITDEEAYEERIKLVGFAMLIKRTVLDKVGNLDERFTPGNFEDDDISLRIVEKGYKLLLCRDSYIHHFGSVSFKDKPSKYRNLLKRNCKKIEDKWGYKIDKLVGINYDLLDVLPEIDCDKNINILQIGFDELGTLALLRNIYKNSNMYIYDKGGFNGDLLKSNANLFNEEDNIKFDYIILSKVSAYISEFDVMASVKKILKNNGVLTICLPEIKKELGDNITWSYITITKDEIEKRIDEEILCLFEEAKKLNNRNKEIVDRIEKYIKEIIEGKFIEENTNCIISGMRNNTISYSKLIEVIENQEERYICDLLTLFTKEFYNNKLYEYIIPICNSALDYDEKNKEVLMNLSLFLNDNTEYDLAIAYLDKIEDKDDEILELIEKIRDNKRPLISICIPTYNRAKCLDKCLLSIFSQIGNDKRFEIVISDNDSPDNTKEVVDKYKLFYKNINYWKNEKNIVQENFVKVMDGATGRYILLHGDDDYFQPGSLMELLNIVQNNMDNSAFFINVLNDNKKVIKVDGLNEFVSHICGTSSIFISCIMIKKEYYDEVENKNYYIEQGMNQTYILFEVISKYSKICIINNAMFFYENSLDGNYSWPQIFIDYYFSLLKEYIDKNKLSEDIFLIEKKRMIEVAIGWCKAFKSQGKFNNYRMRELLVYLDKYYKEELYFKQVYEIINNIIEEVDKNSVLIK